MTIIREDISKTFTHRLPVAAMRGVLTIDMQLVVDLSRHQPGWQVLGERIGDLNPLWPFGHFRTEMLRGAKKFVRDLGQRGYALSTPEADMAIWGPYPARNWKRQRDGNFKAYGRAAGEVLWDDACDFLIIGDFVASRLHLVEASPRPAWAAAMDAEMDARSLDRRLRTAPEPEVLAALAKRRPAAATHH